MSKENLEKAPRPDFDTTKPQAFEDKIEEEIVQKGLTAPRVTKAEVDVLYKQVTYVFGRVSETRILCSAQLDGFTIADGFGACVDPENFDEEVGMKIAHKKCALATYDKLWELEGYRLSRSLNEAKVKPNTDFLS